MLSKKSSLLVAVLTLGLILPISAKAETVDLSRSVKKSDSCYTITLKQGSTLKVTLSKDNPAIADCDFRLLSDGIIQETSQKDYFEIQQPELQLKDRSFSFLGLKTGQTILLLCKKGTTQDEEGNTVYKDPEHPLEDVVTFIVNVVDSD